MSESNQNNTTDESSSREHASESSIADEKLVEQALNGEEDAYTQLVNKYERALFFHILKMVKDREQVEDLVQEAFSKAFDNLRTYDNRYAFSTWLYRIATNHTIDYLRKKKLDTLSIDKPVRTKGGEMKMQLPDKSASADRAVIKKQRQKMVRQAIKDLPEKYRRVIHLRHMEEKTYKEIADELELPLGTVKAHIFRARELLYKELKGKRHRF